jgi:cell division protein FtsN
MRTAAVSAPPPPAAQATHTAGGYAVQVSSQRSEADAQAAFRGLQAKYPKILGGRQASIHKVELGAKGTYYRAMVGPFANANEATELCNGLRAAGGQCLIQRN